MYYAINDWIYHKGIKAVTDSAFSLDVGYVDVMAENDILHYRDIGFVLPEELLTLILLESNYE